MATISTAISSKPICSVCIANYNGVGLIEDCIDSVLAQDCQENIEIIVHDDASTDESVKLIRERYPQIKLIESHENVGFCISNNRMVAQTRGEYILLLNNDAALLPDALKTLYAEAQSSPVPAILGLPQYDATTNKLIDIGSYFDPFLNPIPSQNNSDQQVGMVIGACFWLPKSLWDELGGFPEWFGSLAEDMYLCCVARLWGYQVKALPRSGFIHKVGSSLGGGKVVNRKLSTSTSRRTLSERNKTYVMFMTYPISLLLLMLPLHLMLLLAEGIVLSIVKLDPNLFFNIYLNCFNSLFYKRKILLRMRKMIQSKRKYSVVEFCKPFTWMPYKITMLLRHGVPKISNT